MANPATPNAADRKHVTLKSPPLGRISITPSARPQTINLDPGSEIPRALDGQHKAAIKASPTVIHSRRSGACSLKEARELLNIR
jgi:hypothetical protein